MKAIIILSVVIAVTVGRPSGILAPHLASLGYAIPGSTIISSPGIVAANGPALLAAAGISAGAPAVVSAAGPVVVEAKTAVAAPAAAVAAPAIAVATPAVAAAPVAVGVVGSVSSQYHAQDALGQYTFGYSSPLSAQAEAKSIDGITRGGYTYLDAEGKVQSVSYTSDAAHGFRVAATNIPIPVAPVNIPDSPVVAAAKAAHFAAQEEAKAVLASANAAEASEAAAAKAVVEAAAAQTAADAKAAADAAAAKAAVDAKAAADAEAAAQAVAAKAQSDAAAAAAAAAPAAVVEAKIATAPAAVRIDNSQAALIAGVPRLSLAGHALATIGVAPGTTIIGPSSYSYSSASAQQSGIIAASPAIASYNAYGSTLVAGAPTFAISGLAAAPAVDFAAAKLALHAKSANTIVAAAPVPVAGPVGIAHGVSLTAAGIPADTPEVAQAKAAHLAAFEAIKLKSGW